MSERMGIVVVGAVFLWILKAILKVLFSLAGKYHKDIYAVVSNMSIAVERKDLLKRATSVVCNEQEAEILFSENYDGMDVDTLAWILCDRIRQAKIREMPSWPEQQQD